MAESFSDQLIHEWLQKGRSSIGRPSIEQLSRQSSRLGPCLLAAAVSAYPETRTGYLRHQGLALLASLLKSSQVRLAFLLWQLTLSLGEMHRNFTINTCHVASLELFLDAQPDIPQPKNTFLEACCAMRPGMLQPSKVVEAMGLRVSPLLVAQGSRQFNVLSLQACSESFH